jgi:hypothetical protein
MFTPEQLTFLEKLIDQRIALVQRKAKSSASNFHSLPEIRQLIIENKAMLLAEFGYQPFGLKAFRHVLTKMTTLRPGDHEPNGDSEWAQPRWEAQVYAVISKPWFPAGVENPIERIKGREARFRFRPPMNDPFN